MRAFADLLENLLFAPGRNAKLALMVDYFRRVPDPDRGWALAALTGDLSLPSVTSSRIRGLVSERVDPELFRMSYDYVGDLAETVALIWPDSDARESPALARIVDQLAQGSPGFSQLHSVWSGLFAHFMPSLSTMM